MLRANSSSFKASNISPQESVPKVEKFLPFVKEEVLSGIYNVCSSSKLHFFVTLIDYFCMYYKIFLNIFQDVFPCTAEQFSELLLGSGSNFMREYRALRKDTNLAVCSEIFLINCI